MNPRSPSSALSSAVVCRPPPSSSTICRCRYVASINAVFGGIFWKKHISLCLQQGDMSGIKVLDIPSNKMCVNLSSGKRELQKSCSVSEDSSTTSTGEFGASGDAGGGAGGAPGSGGGTSKLSKIGRRLRESCRNLRGKTVAAPRHNPEDYTSLQAPNESTRSRHYVAMDFTGKVGRIVDNKDLIRGYASKDGYAYFRRKVSPKEVEPLLAESQAKAHLRQPWFHKGISRDLAQRILATHNVDGAFLVRESSVSGGFVISYVFGGRTFHAQAMPDADSDGGHVFYTLDDAKTRFFDLLQMVEFYQLNKGSLNSKLTHYIVRGECQRSESPTSRSEACSSQASEASMESQQSLLPAVSSSTKEEEEDEEDDDDSKTDTNHNSSSQQMQQQQECMIMSTTSADTDDNTDSVNSATAEAVALPAAAPATAAAAAEKEDAAMASEGDSDSLREFHQG